MIRDSRLRRAPAPCPRPAPAASGRLAVLAAATLASGCMALSAADAPQPAPGLAAPELTASRDPRPAPPSKGLAPAAAAPAPGPLAEGASWSDRGVSLLRADRPDAAVAAFRRALAEEGLTPRALIGLGAAHRAQGLTTEARRILARAVRAWPELPAARNNHGAALYDLGRYAAAEAEFRAAADIMARQGRAPGPEILRNLALAIRAREAEAREAPRAPDAPLS